jgi:hypothetical protein
VIASDGYRMDRPTDEAVVEAHFAGRPLIARQPGVTATIDGESFNVVCALVDARHPLMRHEGPLPCPTVAYWRWDGVWVWVLEAVEAEAPPLDDPFPADLLAMAAPAAELWPEGDARTTALLWRAFGCVIDTNDANDS